MDQEKRGGGTNHIHFSPGAFWGSVRGKASRVGILKILSLLVSIPIGRVVLLLSAGREVLLSESSAIHAYHWSQASEEQNC